MNNDWIFNWSAALAYTFLVSIVPIFLVILALTGFVLGAISPQRLVQLENTLAGALPGGASGSGGEIVRAVLQQLHQSVGGAEVNALAMGLPPTIKSLSAMLEDVQEQDTMEHPSRS